MYVIVWKFEKKNVDLRGSLGKRGECIMYIIYLRGVGLMYRYNVGVYSDLNNAIRCFSPFLVLMYIIIIHSVSRYICPYIHCTTDSI